MSEDSQAKDAEKPKMGRPTVYRPEFVAQVEKLCTFGATDAEIADFFGVNVVTIHRWKLAHEDFCNALKAGKSHADERTERSLFHKANGYDYTEEQAVKVKVDQHTEEVRIVEVKRHQPADTTAAIFWLKNRRADEWRDKREVNMVHDVRNMTREEILAELAELGADIADDGASPVH